MIQCNSFRVNVEVPTESDLLKIGRPELELRPETLERTVYNACSDDSLGIIYGQKNFNVDELNEEKLAEACKTSIDICNNMEDVKETETNLKLIDFVLQNTKYDSDNRLTMPLMWNSKNSHLLSRNYLLSKNYLN